VTAPSDSQEEARKEALNRFLEARVAEGFRIETRTDTHAIVVSAASARSFLDRLRRVKTSERQVVSVNEHGEVTTSPAEPLRF
jgi:hypothetical protein